MNREELFTMMTAYKQTSVLKAGIQLGVFDHLADGPVDAETVAAALGAAPRGVRVLLDALAAIETTHEVRVLYAAESGSRAWGFPFAGQRL